MQHVCEPPPSGGQGGKQRGVIGNTSSPTCCATILPSQPAPTAAWYGLLDLYTAASAVNAGICMSLRSLRDARSPVKTGAAPATHHENSIGCAKTRSLFWHPYPTFARFLVVSRPGSRF